MQLLRRVLTVAVTAALLSVPGQAQRAASDVPIAETQVPWERSRPRDPFVAPDGKIWFVGQVGNYVAVFDPATNDVEEWAAPSGAGSQPYAMADDDADADRIRYVETGVQPNRMIGFDPQTKSIISNTAITGGQGRNTVRHMVFDPKTRSIWYGSDNGFLGKVSVPPKPIM